MRKRLRTPWTGLEMAAFVAFLIWSGAGLFFNAAGPHVVEHWALPEPVRNFVALCLAHGDVVLILLAFANTHLHAARQWSAPLARRWCMLILVASFVIETIGAQTGLPFGSYHYTDRFGPQLGLVPVTIPLAWHVVVTNALFLVRAALPSCSRLVEAGLTGLIAAAYDFVLEPFATRVKDYWVWSEGAVPPLNYAAWFVISALLVRFLAPTLANRERFDLRPAALLGITLLIFLTARSA